MVCDTLKKGAVNELNSVLILILLEYGLRRPQTQTLTLTQQVLILILLEYGLRLESLLDRMFLSRLVS